ncbi:MAG: hypothetical protein J6B87_02745 [Clostridia bacterium]|nr:hypothetical protein [Clostridia bacterium]
MGRKKAKYTPFKSYETNISNSHKTEQHVRLTRSLLVSEAYKDLGKNETKLLNYMKLISKGEDTFEFAASLGVSFLGLKEGSEKSVRTAIKSLCKHGFIKTVRFSNGSGHIPNEYEFDIRWRTWTKSSS